MSRRRAAVALIVVGSAACSLARAPRDAQVAYVTLETGGAVAVVDVERGTVVDRIEVGKRPRGLRLSPDGATLLVALSGSPIAGPHGKVQELPPADRSADGIAIVDLAARRVVRTIRSGADPESFDLSADGRKIYVSNEGTAEVSVVEVATGRLLAAIPVGEGPEGVRTRPDGAFVYVTNEGAGTVSVIDTSTDRVVAGITVGERPRSIVFTRDGAWAFVSAEQSAQVALLDARAHRLVALIPIPPGPGRVWPMGLALSPDETTLYVSGGRGRLVAVVDVATRTVARTIDEVGTRPWGIAVTADGRTLISANGPSRDVSLIDLASGKVRRVPVEAHSWGVAVR